MRLEATELSTDEQRLRDDVRAFLADRLPPGNYDVGLGFAAPSDPAFSRDLGARGWLGMALPKEYGGGGRTAVERLIVVEELLAVGAPVGWHWVADRQSGPNIAANGTDEQKQYFLPRIASGQLSFAIGMSEPDAGSDLAAVRTRAIKVDGGWLLNGTKIWTSGAAEATHLLGLFRTSQDRYRGLTQFIVDRDADGLTPSKITFIDGTRHFCEVAFDDVFVPESRRLGEVGAGWGQNTAELVLERGGVDRWMSVMPVLDHWAGTLHGAAPGWARTELGSVAARCWAFHGLSLSIARAVDRGESPTVEAALAKEMATRFEQECIEIVLRHFGRTPELTSPDPYESLLARAVLTGPSFTIRGGTTEIMRNIISKALITS
ncbi:Acyl-CoA dehydrogenase related to the alkylation response protein AidB [Mycobacterium rhizamassiliense]|uniref:Acyl-CoA dehydrogenase related to the alkylation response protein AidB n=2 Tax=Mycobacterium TaxID=1763 RepID=A0A2U3PAR1_9MYCO|nr:MULTISPECIES: acyl-CoA dehydrogenase family protein [Mycobacterium]SPM34936.1 Acyl-CoA dehydrogenase related to the alkylation response protein AidB [Mycobacterium rhizamassiliense]SPM40765.1 Acyl-CoA dehydrogenase related to the alkylation response protein AidB [Mycobacterium numidiamassiliense]